MTTVIAGFLSPGMVHAEFMTSMTGVASHSSELIGVMSAAGAPRMSNLNHLAMGAIDTADYLWLVDSDMIFPSNSLDLLLEASEPIVSGVYYGADGLPVFNFGKKIDEDGEIHLLKLYEEDWPEGVFPVVATGEGCLLISTEVLVEVFDAYPVGLSFFNDIVSEETGVRTYEEDFFFDRVKEVTCEVPYIQPLLKLGHIKSHVITHESVQKERHGR